MADGKMEVLADQLASLVAFDKALCQHDWAYRESDELDTYESGHALHTQLVACANLSDAHKRLFDAYVHNNAANMEYRAKAPDMIEVRFELSLIDLVERDAQRLVKYDYMLARHDWYYSYIEDGKQWRPHEDFHQKLLTMSQISDRHKQLYDAHHLYATGGGGERLTFEAFHGIRLQVGVISALPVKPPPPAPPLDPNRGKHLKLFDVQLKLHNWKSDRIGRPKSLRHLNDVLETDVLEEKAAQSEQHRQLYDAYRRTFTLLAGPAMTREQLMQERKRLGVWYYDPDFDYEPS